MVHINYKTYNSITLSKDKLQTYISDFTILNKNANLINTIFDKCDNTFAISKGNLTLEENELKMFIKSLNPEAAEIIRKQFFTPQANNFIIESIGDFEYTSGAVNQSYRSFEKAFKQNEYKFENKRYVLFNKLREMIKNGEISFSNGLSESELENLFNLNTKVLEKLVNKKFDVNKLWHSENNQAIERLLNGDYSSLDSIDMEEIFGHKQIVLMVQEFKNQKGVSIYQDIINQYENGNISEADFLKSMKTLLDKCGAYFSLNDAPQEINNIVAKYSDTVNSLKSGKYSLEAIKEFDFDKYFEEVFVPDAQYFVENDLIYLDEEEKIQELSTFNLNGTQIAQFRPKSVNTEIAKNTRIQTFNDVEYTIIQSDNLLTITDGSKNKNYVINFDTLLSKIDSEEYKNKAKEIILNLDAPTLIDLSLEVDFIKAENNENHEYAAIYSGHRNDITINFYHEFDSEKTKRVLTHEIGHSLDYMRLHGTNDSWIQSNSTLTKIIDKEMKALKSRPYYEKQYATTDPMEMFAECYTLLMTGKSVSSDYTLATFFPETVKYISEHIEQIRARPLEDRHYSNNP